MNITISLTPEEFNLVHKGLSKLSIEEALPTLQKLVSQVQSQINQQETEKKEQEHGNTDKIIQ